MSAIALANWPDVKRSLVLVCMVISVCNNMTMRTPFRRLLQPGWGNKTIGDFLLFFNPLIINNRSNM